MADAVAFSEIAGETEVYNTSHSVSPEVSPTGRVYNKTSTSSSVTTDSRVKPEELLQMEKNHAFVVNQGQSGKLKMPVFHEDLPMPDRPQFGNVSEYLELYG